MATVRSIIARVTGSARATQFRKSARTSARVFAQQGALEEQQPAESRSAARGVNNE